MNAGHQETGTDLAMLHNERIAYGVPSIFGRIAMDAKGFPPQPETSLARRALY